MTRTQLLKQLKLAHKEAIMLDNRLYKISIKLEIPENADLKNVIEQIQKLIEIGESKC